MHKVIARIARAKRPRRELFGIQFDGGLEPPPSTTGLPIFIEGADEGTIGLLTSLVGTGQDSAAFGLGLIKVISQKDGELSLTGARPGSHIGVMLFSHLTCSRQWQGLACE